MKKTVLVLGLGRYGSALAVSLADRGAEVIGVDRDPALVDALKDRLEHLVVGDLESRELLDGLVSGVDVAVVAVGERLEQAILAVMRLKEKGVPHVIARATNDEADRIFRKLGADEVVRPMREAAEHLAGTITAVNAVDFVLLGENFGVIEYRIDDLRAGRTLQELAWRKRFNVVAIGIKRGKETDAGGERVEPADPEQRLMDGDRVLLAGLTRHLVAFQKDN
jgi:trk system potassium uptake protein TrkA